MKLQDFDQVKALRDRLVAADKQLAEFKRMTEPNMAWDDHKGLLRAEVRHPKEYRAGSVEINIALDYVSGALKIERQLVIGQLRELGVEVE